MKTTSYPGTPAQFICQFDDWKDTSLREIHFESKTPGSLIKTFTLIGYWNGSIAISMRLEGDSDTLAKFRSYLSDRCCQMDPDSHYIYTDKVRSLFDVIRENNRIPNNWQQKIQSIVDKGYCDPFPKPDLHGTGFCG